MYAWVLSVFWLVICCLWFAIVYYWMYSLDLEQSKWIGYLFNLSNIKFNVLVDLKIQSMLFCFSFSFGFIDNVIACNFYGDSV